MASSSGSGVLSFCGELIRIDPEQLARLGRQLDLGPFLGSDEGLEVHHSLVFGHTDDKMMRSFAPESGAVGGYLWTEEGIAVHPCTDSLGVSFALRGLFSRAIERRGGVLVHAAGVTWEGRTALITGASGAGKSTLARWSVKEGATLLSDEVVGVLPDGSVYGTPFRSDPDLQGTSTVSRLHLVTTLRHGRVEFFEAAPPRELIAVLCEQAFHRDRELSAAQVLRCVARAVEGVETTRFTCRNAASAATALRARLLEGSAPGR